MGEQLRGSNQHQSQGQKKYYHGVWQTWIQNSILSQASGKTAHSETQKAITKNNFYQKLLTRFCFANSCKEKNKTLPKGISE